MTYPKPLMQVLSIKEQDYALTLSLDVCDRIIKLANLKFTYDSVKRPGEQLLKCLDKSGCTLEQYRTFLKIANTACYTPKSKVAILISNDKYNHLNKLATPSLDCESIGAILRNMGFITISVKNTTSAMLKEIFIKTIGLIPEDSYCFIFYAGHGCELINTKCILSINCPEENIKFDHCVTENWLLRESAKCKPELCILILDMCRFNLERDINPQIYAAIVDMEDDYTIHSNLLISYSTQSSNNAYERILIEKDKTISTTYSLQSADVVCGGASQYANALCTRLTESVDVSSLLDRVHEDVESSSKKQRPIKVQCGVSKRFLHDPVKGDMAELLKVIREALGPYGENCISF